MESDPDGNPTKWEVYEQILKVPYYVVYDREGDEFRGFHLESDRYEEIELTDNRLWLRFYDADFNWILTPEERERQEKERLKALLRAHNIDPDGK